VQKTMPPLTRSARKTRQSLSREDPPDVADLMELPDTVPRSARKGRKSISNVTPKKKLAQKSLTPASSSSSSDEEPPQPVARRSGNKKKLTNEYNDARSQSPVNKTPRTPEKGSSSVNKKDIATWGGADLGSDSGFFWGRESLGPLFLMTAPPLFIFVLWHLQFHCNGDLTVFWNFVMSDEFTFYGNKKSLIPSPFDPTAWKMILGFSALELTLMKVVPGEVFRATVTPKGNIPIYIANGFQCFVITLAILGGLIMNKEMNPDSVYDPSLVYDKFGNCISSLNVIGFVLCTFLTFKGKNFPSSSDSGTTGNAIIDFYWGTELYPRVFGWDIKVFTNCRFGMMYWGVGIICYAYKQFTVNGFVSDSMLISVVLQLIYCAKFFYWETGYFCSMDIQHDRAGYYLCWGCLVWVPSVYASQSFYLVNHPVQMSQFTIAFNLIAGILSIWINYDADRQRQNFRACEGHCEVWGRSPVMIRAKYTTSKGEERNSLLLASGWWGLSRHFHYIPEILAAFFWTVPFACEGHIIPFFYVIYLTILLFDRAFRDDVRCANKYGTYWGEYCSKVPYKIIPGVV
jgi:7-dehydrocholesterol reductase